MNCTFPRDAFVCSKCGRPTSSPDAMRNCSAGQVVVPAAIAEVAIQDCSNPGDELAAILRDWLGIEAEAGCGCKSMASLMNAAGPDWCESDAGLAEILGVMRAEHAKRWADGRTRLPWSDFAATQLVRLACRRARAKAAS